MSKNLLWEIPLNQKPRLIQVGNALHDSMSTEKYQMRNLWSMHFYHYEAVLGLGNVSIPIHPGNISVIPPNVEMEFRFNGPSRHTFAHFTFPEDGAAVQLPAMSIMRHEFHRLQEGIQQVVRSFPHHPLRAEIGLWNILWELADFAVSQHESVPRVHPAYVKARALIDSRLGQDIKVAQLAEDAGISHNQLTRLFQKETGDTVIASIHHLRAQRAHHLLTDTTLPIKAIAARIGIPDPHHFNKFIRRMLGAAPSAVRELYNSV